MKRKNVILLSSLMGVAVIGVVVMQFYYLYESYKLKSELFDRSVTEALTNVTAKIEKQETAYLFKKRIQSSKYKDDKRYLGSFDRQKRVSRKKGNAQNTASKEFFLTQPVELSASEILLNISEDVNNQLQNLHRLQQTFLDEWTSDKVVVYPTTTDSLSSVIRLSQEPTPSDEERIVDQLKNKTYVDSAKRLTHQVEVLKQVVNEFNHHQTPLHKRLDAQVIDSLLRQEFHHKEIDLPFDYKVYSRKTGAILFKKITDHQHGFQDNNTYQTSVFPTEVVRDQGKLVVSFPQKNNLILKRMSVMMSSSFLLLLVVISCFAYTINTVLKQKKISEMKIDFVNNMTHEFKTPVSTILLASEALKDANITKNPESVYRLASIIYDENERLGNHIENVLSIAQLERVDFKLERELVDMHELINNVVDTMNLQLDKRNANFSIELKATQTIVLGDEMHLANVIFNLIDNAIKYSSAIPEITITSANQDTYFLLTIADKGIGMTKEEVSKIFEQFYRVSTGNLHDVKGFGLGLSYVHTVIKKMNATIIVHSEKEIGSTFEIRLPLA